MTGRLMQLCLGVWLPTLLLILSNAGIAAPAIQDRSQELGLPFLRNYGAKEYGAHEQNWDVVQDKRGLVYVANNFGVLEFDGAHWRLITLPSEGLICSLALDESGRVVVGGRDEIGYLAPDKNGRMSYVTMNDRIPVTDRITDIRKIISTPQGIYFLTQERLFLVAKDRVVTWKAQGRFTSCHYVLGRIFIQDHAAGLIELVHGNMEPIPGGESFGEGKRIACMLPLRQSESGGKPTKNEQILIGTAKDGFFTLEGSRISPFPTKVDHFIKSNILRGGTLLADGTLALGTQFSGVLRMSVDGKWMGSISKPLGLSDQSVWSLRPDAASGLWLTLDKGVSRLEWPSPLTLFDERLGLKGSVYALHRHKGILYLGTSEGTFVLLHPAESSLRFAAIAGIRGQTWGFLSMGEELLVASQRGVYRIQGNQAFPIIDTGSTAISFLRSRRDPSRVFVGMQDGLMSLYHRGSGWVNEGRIQGIPATLVRTLYEADDGDLWLGTRSRGLIRVAFKGMGQGAPAPSVDFFGPEQGLPEAKEATILPLHEGLVVSTNQRIYRFQEATKRFILDPRFSRLFPEGPRLLMPPKEDAQGHIWMSTFDGVSKTLECGVAVPQPDGSYLFEKVPLLGFAGTNIYSIFTDDDGVIWFGGPEGLIRYDPRVTKNYLPTFDAIISRVEKAGGRQLYVGTDARPIPELAFAENKLRFEFALPAYDQPEANRFQILLEGRDRAWSPWTGETYKEFTDLPNGSYRFRVRAKNVYGQMSREASYAFRIKPPWYRTWWFKGSVVLCLLSLGALLKSLYFADPKKQWVHSCLKTIPAARPLSATRLCWARAGWEPSIGLGICVTAVSSP
jgi:ligand-binding sensor domain-containing protein